MTTKQRRETRKIELVETHNLALSIMRMRNAPGCDTEMWKRALYHALAMTYTGSWEEKEGIRKTLHLP